MTDLRRLAAGLLLLTSFLAAPALERLARTPYVGAIVVDAATGRVLFEDRADERGYPASVTKLVTLAVVLDEVAAGRVRLDDRITVSAEVAGIGGSQVYLKQGEVFTVDDLLYALMIASANDAAVALANHAGGTRAAFVAKMNAKAQALGLRHTIFQSPHGLPPGRGQLPDISTARELAVLARAALQDPATLRYTSVRVRTLREQSASPFVMTNHNHLLGRLAGCDGLKTGYFSAAGSSIAVTAQREGRRVIAVVLGTEGSKARDLKAMELVEKGFAALGPVAGSADPGRPAAPRSATSEGVPVVRTGGGAAPEQASTPDEPLIKFTPPASRRSP